MYLAVVGPGLLAGLSDDDPAGITTYSVLGAQYGYQMLWVLTLSVIALMMFHGLGARVGVVTGQGLAGLIRQRFGARRASIALLALVGANLGTTCAEFAGIAAGMELFGVSRYISVPVAAVGVGLLVLRGGFRRIERVLMVLSSVFLTYVVAGFLSHPDWGAAARGVVVPSMPGTREAVVLATATIGTTLAPWGQAFIQSYAIDKKLTTDDLKPLRADVISGSALTGIIGFFVVITCAATLFAHGQSISDAADAAKALEPLAGDLAAQLFGIGLVGAGLLAASILPLSTAYSAAEFLGVEGALDLHWAEAPVFYGTYVGLLGLGAVIVLIPGAPLVPILVLTQVINAVLLLPLLAFMYVIANDRSVMGEHVATRGSRTAYQVLIAGITTCVLAMGVLTITG